MNIIDHYLVTQADTSIPRWSPKDAKAFTNNVRRFEVDKFDLAKEHAIRAFARAEDSVVDPDNKYRMLKKRLAVVLEVIVIEPDTGEEPSKVVVNTRYFRKTGTEVNSRDRTPAQERQFKARAARRGGGTRTWHDLRESCNDTEHPRWWGTR